MYALSLGVQFSLETHVAHNAFLVGFLGKRFIINPFWELLKHCGTQQPVIVTLYV